MRYITKKRASGILLHITCLPSKYGIGDLGPEAYRFVDFLERTKQSFWQVLPVNPPAHPPGSFSPYNCLSAFAGNTLFISPQLLYQQGLLTRKDIQDTPAFPKSYVDYRKAAPYKTRLLNIAYKRFGNTTEHYERFCLENDSWLENFAVFTALRRHFHNRLWCDWPIKLKDRNNDDLKAMKTFLRDEINREKFLQYLFFEQWFSLKHYCNQKGIKIIGDIPIYVAYDSADVWSNPELFRLTRSKKMRFIAGVPPDLFSPSGQLWGNPVYNWQRLKKTRYFWWLNRIKHNLNMFDIIRIDHFRGFFAYWQVPAGSKTAVNGRWVNGPAEDFFNTLFKHFPSKPIIAEDLGYITPRIRKFIEKFRIANTKVLLFAFGGNPSTNLHFPDNYVKNSVVYTGTHDNNTIKGWFEKEADAEQKKRLFDYIGHKVHAEQVHLELINLAASSIANLVIIPLQDILGLGQEARMNHPGRTAGNWLWRLRPGQITPHISGKLKRLTQINSRG